MPQSIDVLTSSSAPAWPTALRALKSPLPSPNVMVPKQSFETRRPVLPSVAYSMSFSLLFLFTPTGMKCSPQCSPAPPSPSRSSEHEKAAVDVDDRARDDGRALRA